VALGAVVGVVGAVLAAAPVAMGQGFGGGPFGQEMGPSVSPRHVQVYADIVEMDESQRELAMALFESYTGEVRAEAEKFRAAMQDARATFEETRDREAFEGVRERGEAMQARRTELEQTFLSDVKSLLTPEQAERWPKVERAHRRMTTLDRGLMSGEQVDLIEIAAEMEVGDDPQVAEALAAYEMDLDRALERRNTVIQDGMGRVRELFQEGDQDRIEKLFDNARTASKQVRDTNRRYAEQLAALMAPEKAEAFERAVRERTLPRVYRPTHAQRSVEAALGFDDLTEDQRAAVQALRDRHQTASAPINAQLERAIEKSEEEAAARTFIRMQFARGRDGARGGRGDDGTRELMEKRRDLDRQTLNLLSEALTEDQIQRLPRPEPQGEGDRGRRGGQNRGGRGGRDFN